MGTLKQLPFYLNCLLFGQNPFHRAHCGFGLEISLVSLLSHTWTQTAVRCHLPCSRTLKLLHAQKGFGYDLLNKLSSACWTLLWKHTLETISFSPSQSNVFMYYGLSNFYQNHRRYVKSRDDSQLNGDRTALKVYCWKRFLCNKKRWI